MSFEKKGSFVQQLCPKRCLYLSFGDWFISLSVTSPGSIAVMPREGGPSYGRGLFRGAFVPHGVTPSSAGGHVSYVRLRLPRMKRPWAGVRSASAPRCVLSPLLLVIPRRRCVERSSNRRAGPPCLASFYFRNSGPGRMRTF